MKAKKMMRGGKAKAAKKKPLMMRGGGKVKKMMRGGKVKK